MGIKEEFYKIYKTERYNEDIKIREYYNKYNKLLDKVVDIINLKNKEDNLKTKVKSYVYKIQEAIDVMEKEISKIKSIPHGYIFVHNEFLSFLRSSGLKIESSLPKHYATETRRLEMIKLLQKPCKKAYLADYFDVDPKTISTDLEAIEKGVKYCGYILKVKVSKYRRDGNNTIDDEEICSSCNPIGLALNMSEIYFLTKMLPKKLEKDKFYKTQYNDILEKILPQLSSTANELMGFKQDDSMENEYVLECEDLKESALKQINFVLKRSKFCTFIYKENNEIKEVEGRIKDMPDECILIQTNDGEIITINYDNFIRIKNFFDGVYE